MSFNFASPTLTIGPSVIRRAGIALVVALSLMVFSRASAQVPPEPDGAAAVQEAPGDVPTEEQRQRAVIIGSLLLALVLMTGIGLLLLVLMLGRRTRLLAKKPLPTCSTPDELWFLRKPRRESSRGEPRGGSPSSTEGT